MTFDVYIAIMSSAAVFLILILVILIEIRMAKIITKLEEISKNAQEFIRLGLSHFNTGSKKRS